MKTTWMFSLTLLASLAQAVPAAAQNVTRQTCGGREPAGYLGISGIDCNCTISAPGSGKNWSFRTEPRITSLEMDAPAGRLLKVGDVITHANGKLITTAEGARELASVDPGESIVLTVRRNGQSLKYAMTAASACPNDTRLFGIYAPERPGGRAPSAYAVAPPTAPRAYGIAPGAVPFSRLPRASFGMGLSCSDCSTQYTEKNNTVEMSFSRPPEVYSIERGGPADKAGIRRGDVITHINGHAMDGDGGRIFAQVRPGETVSFTLRRDGQVRTARVRAQARTLPPSPQLAQTSASLEKARASLQELQQQQAEQLRRIQADLRKSQRMEEQKMRELQREMLAQEQEHRRKLTELASELSGAQSRMRAALADSVHGACPVAATPLPGARTSRTLRYTGMIGGTEIEVRGSYPVSVTESGDEVEIAAGGTVIRLKAPKK